MDDFVKISISRQQKILCPEKIYFSQKIANFQKGVFGLNKNFYRYLPAFKSVLDKIWAKFGQISFRFWTNMQFSISNGIKWHTFLWHKWKNVWPILHLCHFMPLVPPPVGHKGTGSQLDQVEQLLGVRDRNHVGME